jgi:hypothetical protein
MSAPARPPLLGFWICVALVVAWGAALLLIGAPVYWLSRRKVPA